MNNFYRCIVAACADFCTEESFTTQLSPDQLQNPDTVNLSGQNYVFVQRFGSDEHAMSEHNSQTGKQQEANKNQEKEVVYMAKTPIPSQEEPRFLRFQIGMKLCEIERIILIEMFKEYKGDKKKVAKILGVSEKTIYNKIIMYKLYYTLIIL